jgi:nucleotide-binding universal stress UspA family protein
MTAFKMLVTFDRSAFSEQIIDTAARVARAAQAEVHVLYVMPPAQAILAQREPSAAVRYVPPAQAVVAPQGPPLEPIRQIESVDQAYERQRGEALAYLTGVAQRFPRDSTQCLVREGEHPAEEIVRCAEELGVDMIALTTHGRTGLAHAVLGSVADAVVRGSHRPVLLLRPTHQ